MSVEIKNVSKSFGKKQVLKDISLTAEKGEILCLIGPSGAGKTTLIRLITGSLEADSGTVFIDGEKISSIKAIKKTGFMPQSDALYDDLSGYDNMMFFGGLFRLDKKALRSKIDELLKMIDLFDDRDKLVINYSGGMKKRLSLAITLLHEPDILILDEPTVGIDPVLRKRIWDEFEKLRAQGKTILVSTHVMDEAERCQKAALIYNGNLIAYDTIEALRSRTEKGSIEELFFMAGKAGDRI